MTNDEILELKDTTTSKEPTDAEMIAFARAIAAKEREACAEQCEKLKVGLLSYAEIDEYIQECASAIRSRAWDDVPDVTKWVDELRGDDEEWTPDDMAYRPSGLSVEEPPNSTTDVVEPIYQISLLKSPVSKAWIDVDKQTYDDAGLYSEYARRVLYAASPKREWVGLTKEEIEKEHYFPFDYRKFARAVEAKLREKNNG